MTGSPDVVIDWDLDPVDASVTVTAGSVVEWQWDENEPLTVTSGERGSTLAGLLFRSARTRGGSYRVRFLEPGLYHYHDEEHFWNEAVVFVVGESNEERGEKDNCATSWAIIWWLTWVAMGGRGDMPL